MSTLLLCLHVALVLGVKPDSLVTCRRLSPAHAARPDPTPIRHDSLPGDDPVSMSGAAVV